MPALLNKAMYMRIQNTIRLLSKSSFFAYLLRYSINSLSVTVEFIKLNYFHGKQNLLAKKLRCLKGVEGLTLSADSDNIAYVGAAGSNIIARESW